MSPRNLLIGALLCACALFVVFLRLNATVAPLSPVSHERGGAGTESAGVPDDVRLVDPVLAPSSLAERVGASEDQRPQSRAGRNGATAWRVRFPCRVQDPTIRLPLRLEVAIDGPDVHYVGSARRVSKTREFEFTVRASEEALLGATLFAATTVRALELRNHAPFHRYDRAKGYALGELPLASASLDRGTKEAALAPLELLAPTFLGHVLRGGVAVTTSEFYVWTAPDLIEVHFIRWDARKGGDMIPFAAFVSGGKWGASDLKPPPGDEFFPLTGVPVGTDIAIQGSRATLQLSVDLRALPDARSILVRDAASGVPSALTQPELSERAAALGLGLTTLSDKVVGRGLVGSFKVGATTLPSGEYAVEAWSQPDGAGLSYLVASKNVTLTVGTLEFTLR